MKSKKIQLLPAGVAAWISLLLMITATYGASIVIGPDYTDVGTIVIISPKPGDTPETNGTALLNNLAAISADVDTPYLIKLGPGIYDIGTSSLQMKAYVDIEGSGENTTIITGHTGNNSGVVQGANNAEIRFLKVRNTGGGTSAVALSASSLDTSFKMTHMTASASGATNNYGVYNNGSSPTMRDMTASASGGTTNSAVSNFASSPTMTNVTASASGGSNYGVVNQSIGGTFTIRINHSVIKGSTNTVLLAGPAGVTIYVANTQLDGGPVSIGTGTVTCAGVYDENYAFYASTCP